MHVHLRPTHPQRFKVKILVLVWVYLPLMITLPSASSIMVTNWIFLFVCKLLQSKKYEYKVRSMNTK